MSNHDEKTPVIVIGAATTAMSCLRLVARTGHPVFAACPIGSWPTRTRHYRPCPQAGGRIWRGELGDAGLEFLRGMPFRQCVLIPTADDAAIWVAGLPEDLRDRYPVSSSAPDVLLKLQDKSEFARVTEELGVAAPRSFTITSRTDLDSIPFDEIEALFLKPVDSQAFVSRYNRKAIWVQNRAEAEREWQQVVDDGFSMIAQEYVSGAASDHYFIDGFRDRSGSVPAKTARRRWRIYPADFGNSSYCKSVAFDEVGPAWNSLEKLLRHYDYRGIFSAEFKRDSRSGQFRILEVNTRPWVYVEFAGVCGMNMCELAIQDALGRDVPAIAGYTLGKGCVNWFDDFVGVVETPSSSRPSLITLIRQWLTAFKLLHSWRDPRPVVHFAARKVSHHVRKVLGR